MYSPVEQKAYDLLASAAPEKLVKHSQKVHTHLKETFGCTNPDMLATTLLHDLIEDTDVTYKQLAETFGAQIADWVVELSHAKEPTHEDYEVYHNQLKSISSEAQAIKLADELCKLESYQRHYDRVRKHLQAEKEFIAPWEHTPAFALFQKEWQRISRLYNLAE
jgi:guanosine-3',5'-bis(diphosphate) 3'-pyrophosphohydrolase